MAKGKLTQVEKAAIIGMQLQGSSPEEIAEALERPVGTINRNLASEELLSTINGEEKEEKEDKTYFVKEAENGRKNQAVIMTPAESSRSDGTRKSDHRALDFVFEIKKK